MNGSLNYSTRIILLAMSLGFVSSGVTANDGTITFSGSITAATCDISGGDESNPNQGADFTVTLPNVSTTALSAAGLLAGDTPFFINLSGSECANDRVANVVFERAQSTNIDAATGNLKNHTVAGAAKNVQVRVLNHDKKVLNLNLANTSHQPVTITSNTAQFKYWGQYIATGGAAGGGTVNTDVIYSVAYR